MSIEDILRKKSNEEIYRELKCMKPSLKLVFSAIKNDKGFLINQLINDPDIDHNIKDYWEHLYNKFKV